MLVNPDVDSTGNRGWRAGRGGPVRPSQERNTRPAEAFAS